MGVAHIDAMSAAIRLPVARLVMMLLPVLRMVVSDTAMHNATISAMASPANVPVPRPS